MLAVLATAGAADTLRLATYNAELSSYGPGLVLQSLQSGKNPAVLAVVSVIAAVDADVLVLTGIDYDLRGEALTALNHRLETLGKSYPYKLALRPNTGVPTGYDIDGNGLQFDARDMQGFGRFAGQAGIAVLSRLPIDVPKLRDFSGFLWADLPDGLIKDSDPAHDIQRLSTSGHYEVPVLLPNGKALRLLVYYATPPVFDGPEDRNGRRNHDETAFWSRLLAGALAMPPPAPPFVIMGQTNLDPEDGEGRPEAIRALMAHSALQDPAPKGSHGRQEPNQHGDPAFDTALYPKLGGLRVEQILPSADLSVISAGVLWPPESDPMAVTLATASRHRPLWVDLALP